MPGGSGDQTDDQGGLPKSPGSMPMVIALLGLLLLWSFSGEWQQLSAKELSYSEFKLAIQEGRVEECAIRTDTITGKLRPEPKDKTAKETTQGTATAPTLIPFKTVRVEDPELIDELEKAGVRYTGVRTNTLLQTLMIWFFPLLIIFWVIRSMGRRLDLGGSALTGFGKAHPRIAADRNTGVSFADVAGCVEAKQELQEVVHFLSDPERYQKLGAHIPKGVLLTGPPGTGKTLLARAVAGEAGVPFYSLSGSDFVEMFVGVGAARVRDLFVQAKANAPCIVFIDELDAVGRVRSIHVGVTNDEREHTLNQLLVELDGFEPNSGVILLAATNRPDVLDPALMRAGRFDRQVVLDAPDIDGRRAILEVHSREKLLGKDVDLSEVAKLTVGFSGADLANAINEAALLAARLGHEAISQRDLLDAVERVVAGPERKSRRLSEDDKTRIATHEVGHALVATCCEFADPVNKISIVPRGRAALGYTLQLPTGEHYLMTRGELLDRIRCMLGGRAAEDVVFGEVSTGAENDLEHATILAQQIICLYGMGASVGLAHLARPAGQEFFGPNARGFARDCSDETSRLVDEEVKQTLDTCYEEARQILLRQRGVLDEVVTELLRSETLEGKRLEQLLAKAGASKDAQAAVTTEA